MAARIAGRGSGGGVQLQSSGASDASAAIGAASDAADVDRADVDRAYVVRRWPTLANVDVVGDRAEGAGVSASVRRCIRPWVTVEGLEMTTAMHAHAAITVPWV